MILERPDDFSKSIPSPSEQQQCFIADSIKRWGCSASVALFDPTCQFFCSEKSEGVIGYKNKCGCAVVFGDPICSCSDLDVLMKEFQRTCQEQKRPIIGVVASSKFKNWAIENEFSSFIEFGEELIVDPELDPTQGPNARKLRNKLSHALRSGVQVHEYVMGNEELKKDIEEVGSSWLKGRKGLQVYLSHLDIFANEVGRRWFYARVGNQLVGSILLNQLASGWVLNLLMTVPEAPHGTSELLVNALLTALRKEGCHFLSFGAVPAAELGQIENLGRFSTKFARLTYKIAMRTFDRGGLKTFWKKFQPRSEPSYLLFSKPRVSFREIAAVIQAMNVGF